MRTERKSAKRAFRKYVRTFALGPGLLDRQRMRYMGYGPIPLPFRVFINSPEGKT